MPKLLPLPTLAEQGCSEDQLSSPDSTRNVPAARGLLPGVSHQEQSLFCHPNHGNPQGSALPASPTPVLLPRQSRGRGWVRGEELLVTSLGIDVVPPGKAGWEDSPAPGGSGGLSPGALLSPPSPSHSSQVKSFPKLGSERGYPTLWSHPVTPAPAEGLQLELPAQSGFRLRCQCWESCWGFTSKLL